MYKKVCVSDSEEECLASDIIDGFNIVSKQRLITFQIFKVALCHLEVLFLDSSNESNQIQLLVN